MKFTEEEKIEAVRRVIEEHQSIGNSARAIGMNPSLLKDYVCRVHAHGYECVKGRRTKRYHSGSFKVQVIKYMKENKLSCNATAAQCWKKSSKYSIAPFIG